MNYDFVPTTIFTPLEYGCVGNSEEAAKEKYGEDNIKVYHSTFKPLEWSFLMSRCSDSCYIKVIVNKANNKVLGMHFLGPNAGEVI